MSWYPHVTVATIVERDKAFLMVHEHAENGPAINQPAGHLEANESLIEAAKRETLEETGWHVEPEALLGISHLNASNGITYIRFTFIAKAQSQNLHATLDSDIISPLWLSYEEIIARQHELRSPLVLNDIRRYLNGERLPLSTLYQHQM